MLVQNYPIYSSSKYCYMSKCLFLLCEDYNIINHNVIILACVCMYIHTYVRMYVFMYVRLYVCVYRCMYVCIYAMVEISQKLVGCFLKNEHFVGY